jgi:hypothetical protein
MQGYSFEMLVAVTGPAVSNLARVVGPIARGVRQPQRAIWGTLGAWIETG